MIEVEELFSFFLSLSSVPFPVVFPSRVLYISALLRVRISL